MMGQNYSVSNSWGIADNLYCLGGKYTKKVLRQVVKILCIRKRTRLLIQSYNRLYEHARLISIRENYKRDMMVNKDEFVYVTYQERKRHELALRYLEHAKNEQIRRRRQKEIQMERERAMQKARELEYGDE